MIFRATLRRPSTTLNSSTGLERVAKEREEETVDNQCSHLKNRCKKCKCDITEETLQVLKNM